MRVAGTNLQLTYCSNIHAGEFLADILAGLDEYVPAIKASVCPEAPFGLGLRLSAVAARALSIVETIDEARDRIEALGAYVYTVNAFPYGDFHGVPVKARVYEPDWRSEARSRFTSEAARALVALLPSGMEGSLSTVPGAFRPVGQVGGAIAQITARLTAAVADLVTIERETGRRISLALEPEPCCLLETAAEACAFFETHLLGRDALAALARQTGLSRPAAEVALRRHLGLCYDVCHGAVEFEDPVAACRSIRAAGISLPKIQLSSAIRIVSMHADLLPAVEAFDTGRYLHQVVVRSGDHLTRFLDIPDAVAAFRAGTARGEWRIHCHVPVFSPGFGAIGTTQDDLHDLLVAARGEELSPHLEVETYTWDILPENVKLPDKAACIARELSFVLRILQYGSDGPWSPRHLREPAAARPSL